MTGIFKTLALVSPILAVLLWYVMSQQHDLSRRVERQDAQFDRTWHEWEQEFSKPEHAAQAKTRAEKADQSLQAMDKEIEEMRAKEKRVLEEFDAALKSGR